MNDAPSTAGVPAAIPSVRFDHDGLAPQDRFEAWSENRRSFELSLPEGCAIADFSTRSTMCAVGPHVVAFGDYSPMISTRSARALRADQFDHYSLRLNLGAAGSARIDIDGRRFIAAPGEAVLTDLARPFRYHSPGGFQVHVFIPRAALDELLPRSLALHGAVPKGACARLLSDHLASLARHMSALTAIEAAAAALATVSLLAASLTATPQTLEQARPAIESALLRQACAFIDQHLTDQGLSVQQICRAFRISRSTLYRLFEPVGGVAQYIKQRRLKRIHALLASPDQVSRQLVAIAEEHGFKSAGHFSRSFREQFGYAPSEVRTRRLPVAAGVVGAPARYDFDAWMQSIRG